MRVSSKRYRIRKKKSILKNRFFRLAVLITFLLTAISWLFFFCPAFQVKKILISGGGRISGQEIERLVWPKIQKKILGFETKAILLADPDSIKILVSEKFPLIDELKVKRLLPDSLLIEIVERKAIGIWRNQESYFSLDKKGVIFEEILKETLSDLTIESKQFQGEISLGKNVIEEKRLLQILTVQKTIEEKAEIKAKEFTFFENEARLDAKTKEGWKIFFDLNGDLNWQLIELELVLEKELPQEKRQGLEYLDLRFNKVYYK
ncbi:MAG: FtsQ-type POTRA domain-containing protein [bacterium]|nr:FtsQ-type POTRA domain-containing protein [bacterium]